MSSTKRDAHQLCTRVAQKGKLCEVFAPRLVFDPEGRKNIFNVENIQKSSLYPLSRASATPPLLFLLVNPVWDPQTM